MQTIDSPPNIVLFTNGALNKVDNIVGLAIAWGRFNPLSVDRDRIFGEDQHLQFFFKQGSVLPCLEPNASCLDVTSLDLRVEPVFLTNWNSLFLLLDELLLEVDCVSLPWKLIVRFRWGSYFWTTLTRSVSLPKLEITLIGSGVGASTVVVAGLFFLS